MPRKLISVFLKCVVIVCAAAGISLSMRSAAGIFMSSRSSLLFFTIQSNIWIALVCLAELILLFLRRPEKRGMLLIKLVFTVSITLTGFVYCVMLAPLLGDYAWRANNVLTHVVVPIAAICDFFLQDTRGVFRPRDSLYAVIPPLYYLIFASVGYVLSWDFGGGSRVPYFFLDWGSPAGAFGFSRSFPYLGTVYYVLFLMLFVVAVAALYIRLTRIRKKDSARENG